MDETSKNDGASSHLDEGEDYARSMKKALTAKQMDRRTRICTGICRHCPAPRSVLKTKDLL
jgi:hypothetical protein